MVLLKLSLILSLVFIPKGYTLDICSSEADSKTCDPKIVLKEDSLASKPEKSEKLCRCLNNSYKVKIAGVYRPTADEKKKDSKIIDLEEKYGDKKEFIDRELSRGLRQSLRNLVSISQNFSEFASTKTDIGNLLPVKADGTPDESRVCNLMAFDKKIKENYTKVAGTASCPASKEEINRRYKEVFQTDVDKESKLFTYYSDFRDELKDGKRSCLDRRDYIALKGLGQSARDASEKLLEAPSFEALRETITDISNKSTRDDVDKSILEGFDQNPLLNLAATDPEFFKAYQAKLKKEAKENQSTVLRDEELYKLAFNRINENCHKLTAGINQYLCEKELEPDIPATDYLDLANKRLQLDQGYKPEAKGLGLENYAHVLTTRLACEAKPKTEIPANKFSIAPTPDDIKVSLANILQDSLTFKSINKKSISEENDEIANFQKAFCKPGIASPVNEHQLDEMIGNFLMGNPDLLKVFTPPKIVKVGNAIIAFDKDKKDVDIASTDPTKLPSITRKDWEVFEKMLLKENLVTKDQSTMLFTALEMRMNKVIEENKDIKFQLQKVTDKAQKLSAKEVDELKSTGSTPERRQQILSSRGLPNNFGNSVQTTYTSLQQQRSEIKPTGAVSDVIFGQKTYAQIGTPRDIQAPPPSKSVPPKEKSKPKVADDQNNPAPRSKATPSAPRSNSRASVSSGGGYSAPAKTVSNGTGSTSSKKSYSSPTKQTDKEIEKMYRDIANMERDLKNLQRGKGKKSSGRRTASHRQSDYLGSVATGMGGGGSSGPTQGLSSGDAVPSDSPLSQNDEMSSNEEALQGQGQGQGPGRGPASADGLPPIDISKVNGVANGLPSGGGGSAELGDKPGSGEEEKPKENLKAFEYPFIIPHGLIAGLGTLDTMVFYLQLEGKRFKTIERKDDFDLKTGEEKTTYILRTYDFIPEGEFKDLALLFQSEEQREESLNSLFNFSRNPQNIEIGKKYSRGTKEIEKVEITPAALNTMREEILNEDQIKKIIIDTSVKYKGR